MRSIFWSLASGFAAANAVGFAAPANAVEKTIVYIECTLADGSKRPGTGVIVSASGHVVTAKHVVGGDKPDGPVPVDSNCLGSIGAANPPNKTLTVQQPTNLSVDAALLQFLEQNEPYEFMRFCTLEKWMIRRNIFVAGFPGKPAIGIPSFRAGVLSTVSANSAGILQTDAQTIFGMSGGPVYSENLAGLIGIVIGRQTAAAGGTSYFGILPIEDYADEFGLTPTTTPCYRETREVDLSEDKKWKSGGGPVKLGVRAEQGVCFLGRVTGQFNDGKDSVGVELQDGEYVIFGHDLSGGDLEGTARCIWYD